jgi:hypothetical protein
MPPVWNQRTPNDAEEMIPVDVTWLQLARSRVATIRVPDRPTDAVSHAR